MWKYLGFGSNFRPKLPSRNWSIFLAITSSFTAAVIYDKRETKRVQRKWCKLVEHIAKEPLDPRAMPRRLTVFLEAPPADGLRAAQDHFKLYVKPILVASGLDWEFVQGRKEGDIRAELAERIRRERTPIEERTDVDEIEDVRHRAGVVEYDGPRGDIVIGRHTWKEYVRGLHEGWLGPLTEPPKPIVEEPQKDEPAPEPTLETLPGITIHSTTSEEALPPATETPKEEEKPKNAPKPAPFILTSAYTSATLPAELPTQFSPSTPIQFPHILGFLNTPRRLYRFLNRRVMADNIGRETAAIILANARPYHASSTSGDFSSDSETTTSANTTQTEQESALQWEEKEWHKSVRKRAEDEPERTWLEPIVLDERIASRMRRFEITAEEEERSKGIFVPEIEIEGWMKGGLRSLGRSVIDLVGLGEKKHVKSGGEMGMEGDEDS
jgi:import inner membrane translocase subunit TIM54